MQHDCVCGRGHGEGQRAAGSEGAEFDGEGVECEVEGVGDWEGEVSEEEVVL